jgi:SAM-dependent methyltransferase
LIALRTAFGFLLWGVEGCGNSRRQTMSAARDFVSYQMPSNVPAPPITGFTNAPTKALLGGYAGEPRAASPPGERQAMNDTGRRNHWEGVYAAKGEKEVSWFQETPAPSLELLALVGAGRSSAIIDIGGGASRLADCLVAQGYEDVTVLDLSAAALASARARIGDKADRVTWIAADVTSWEPSRSYDVWHDRAAFHFLTDPRDQTAYVARLRRALRPGGHAIIGTFALDGPERCSGLVVSRYDADSLAATLGSGFELIDTRRHEHVTPWGATQKFQFSAFRREQD